MKKLFIFLALLITLIVGLGVFLAFKGEEMIASGVTKHGSEMMAVPVKLSSVKVSPFTGQVELSGFTMGQPKGFGEGNMLALDDFAIKLDPASLITKHVKVDVIDLNGFVINVNMQGRETNVGALKKRMDEIIGDDSSSTDIKLSAKTILLRNMKASFKYGDGKKREVALADIELKNLGVDQDGIPPSEMMRHALSALEPQILKAAVKIGIKDELKKLEDKLPDDIKSIKDKAESLLGGLKKKKKDN